MRSKLVEKKVVLSVTIEPSTMQELRKYRDISGVSASWLVSSLLRNFLGAIKDV